MMEKKQKQKQNFYRMLPKLLGDYIPFYKYSPRYKNCGDLFKAYDQEVKDEDSWRLWLGSMSLLTAHSMTN